MKSMTEITEAISNLKQIKYQLDFKKKSIAEMHASIKELEEKKKQYVKVVGLFDKAIQVISANGIGKIESIVSAGLRLVYNDPKMGLVVEKKETARGNSFRLLVQDSKTIGPAMENFGGGVVNIVSFLLRVIMVKRFKLAKFIAIDESLNNVGKIDNHIVKVSNMLKKLCQDYGFTILAITHEPLLAAAADFVYQVTGPETDPVLLKLDKDQLDGHELPRSLQT
jgi:DNA repair ATPase RecN